MVLRARLSYQLRGSTRTCPPAATTNGVRSGRALLEDFAGKRLGEELLPRSLQQLRLATATLLARLQVLRALQADSLQLWRGASLGSVTMGASNRPRKCNWRARRRYSATGGQEGAAATGSRGEVPHVRGATGKQRNAH